MEATFFQAKLFWSKTKVSDYKHYLLELLTCCVSTVYLAGSERESCTENVLCHRPVCLGRWRTCSTAPTLCVSSCRGSVEAQVAVRLIHSSELCRSWSVTEILTLDRVFFNGYYEGPGPNMTRLSETVNCNVKVGQYGLEIMGTGDCCCEYNDPRTEKHGAARNPITAM